VLIIHPEAELSLFCFSELPVDVSLVVVLVKSSLLSFSTAAGIVLVLRLFTGSDDFADVTLDPAAEAVNALSELLVFGPASKFLQCRQTNFKYFL